MTSSRILQFKLAVCFVGCSLAWFGAVAGETPAEAKGRAIIRKYYAQINSQNQRADVLMHLIDSRGRRQTRHYVRISKTDERDQQRYIVIFADPPEVKNTGLLAVENDDRADDVWLYLPSIKKSKRVSGTNTRASFMGSLLTYKDLNREKIHPERNRYVFLKQDTLKGVDHYVLDAFPVSETEKDEQGYSRRRMWIRTDNHVATRIDYYDEAGRHQKTLEGTKTQQVGQGGKWRHFEVTVTDRKGVKTILEFKRILIDTKSPDDSLFTKAYLKRPR